MADQQPSLVKKEDHPHTTPLFSPRFTEEDAPGDGTQQESASTGVSHFVVNGLQLKLDGQDLPFASFTYALTPLTDKLAPVDWKVLVHKQSMEGQHIRCHELNKEDNIANLIADFQNAYALAVVLINISDDYSLPPSFQMKTQISRIPVLLLKKCDGREMLNHLYSKERNVVFARISVEDPLKQKYVGTMQKPRKGPAHPSSDSKEPGFGKRLLKQLFPKHPPLDLTAELKKYMYVSASGKPVVVCENPVSFIMAMDTFNRYEKHAKFLSTGIEEALEEINHHLTLNFPQDFPFYLLLAYKMHTNPKIYYCDGMHTFMKSCIERMEGMLPQSVASTFLAFLQRCDFAVRFGSENPTSVFHLLQQACLEMIKISNRIHMKGSGPHRTHVHQGFVYSRFMWVSLHLRLCAECGAVTKTTANIWKDKVIKYSPHLVMNEGGIVVSEVKKGLQFGQLVQLPSNLMFSPPLLANLFVRKGCVRPFQHLSNYICELESYISPEEDFLGFVLLIREKYEHWLKQDGWKNLKAVSSLETLTDTLDMGLSFLNSLYKICEKRRFNPVRFDPECKKWLLLLLQLVDQTRDNSHVHLKMFIPGKNVVTRKFQQDIINHVKEVIRESFPQLPVEHFLPLYKAFCFWPNKFLEDYLQECKVPSRVRICDRTWEELFNEVVNKLSGAQHHHCLLDFIQSVAKRYHEDNHPEDFVMDLLKLNVPKLFALERESEEIKAMDDKFSLFLWEYISHNALKCRILMKMDDIMKASSDQWDKFQPLVLAVIQKEVVPELRSLQRQNFLSIPQLKSLLDWIVTTLSGDPGSLHTLTAKQQFCWGVVACCCGKIHIAKDRLEWVDLYGFIIQHLGSIYSSFCKRKELPQDKLLLSAESLPHEITHSTSEDIKKYIDWVHRVQAVLLEWKQKFTEQRINYDEILTYANQLPHISTFGRTVCASSVIVSLQEVSSMKNMFLIAFEQLNVLLIKYIPKHPEAGWCSLLTFLQDWGISLPQHLLNPISQHVVFPGEVKVGELLNSILSPSTSGQFQPGQDISLKLTKTLSLHKLSVLVEGLQTFLQPIMDMQDMLVFFKLYPSDIFDKYVQVYLKKESELGGRKQGKSTTFSNLSFTVTRLPPVAIKQPQPKEQSEIESFPHCVQKAMKGTSSLIKRLMQGTAAYSEIVAEGELELDKLNIDQEFGVFDRFAAYLELSPSSYEGLAGIKSILELFQYYHHIQTIQSVCEQYNFQKCLVDPQLVKLHQLVDGLNLEENRAKLTPIEASSRMQEVKKTLFKGSKVSPCCLELFTAVRDSAAFYQFVRDQQFVGEKGQSVFRQQYQLITAQLQHEEYDEKVLNRLYAAFKFIEPFMDTEQSFDQLMLKVTELDITMGLKQLETVNKNITLIQLWFSCAEGDTLQNVANKLDCIIMTGCYLFCTSSKGAELELAYSPSSSHQSLQPSQTSNLENPEAITPQMQILPHVGSCMESQNGDVTEVTQAKKECWNHEQISDFIRKLGFLDEEQEGGEGIKHFLHVSETAYKLLDLYVRLRELGHPQYIQPLMNEFLTCAISREDAEERVHETEEILTTWMQRVTKLRNQYDWLLFFSVPKLLLLYDMLRASNLNLEAIVHEISFLFSNKRPSWESIRDVVEKSIETGLQSDNSPMHVVGRFLGRVFNNHCLPKRRGDNHGQPCFTSQLSPTEPTQVLHYCPGYSQAQLIYLIVSIYNGVPEPFEVFHCHPSSTEEELSLFLKRVAKHPLQYLVLEVNRLSFKLQEHLMQLRLVIHQSMRQEREIEMISKTPCFHFIETAPSILREMPWVVLRTHMESEPVLSFEEACKICQMQVVQPEDFVCVQLVYGHAGDGKTHYIQQQLAYSPASLTISVNEAFTPLNAISKLRKLPLNKQNCAIFFNFTMLPPGDSVDKSEHVRYRQLMEVIGWFFFNLLLLGYVEDTNSGHSFRIPGGQGWAIYVEVPSRDHNMPPKEALNHFQRDVPTLGLLGTPHYIPPDTLYYVDKDVQLVCKYLKALNVGGERGIDRICKEDGQVVKFSTEPDLQKKECQQLLLQYMPDHVKNTKIMQRLFIKYMERRCSFLDSLPAFNYNTGGGEYFTDKHGKKVYTDTEQLGSTLMTTMLKEVEDFCDPAIKENWSLKPHQQLIYDFKDGGSSFGLISLYPDELKEEYKIKFEKIGVRIPSMEDLYSRELLDEYLSRALSVELEDQHLTLIDDSEYVLTLDYTMKMLNIHERYQCGVPVIIEGETGVGKTALVEMLSKLWNHAHLVQWKRQCSRLLDLMRRKLGNTFVDASDNYQVCVQAVETLSVSQHVPVENLVKLGLLPGAKDGHFYSQLREMLLPMKCDPVVALLTLQEPQASLEQLFERVETENTAESTASLLCGVFTAKIKPTFHKLNVHTAMTPTDIWNRLNPVFVQAKTLQEAFVGKAAGVRLPNITVFLDEVNTSSCLGLFKEIIVDRTFDGVPIPDNVFIVAACNPQRGNSLASHSQKETWIRGSYYVRLLHPTLRFLMWDYGSLDEKQERDYISAKMRMLNQQMPNVEVACLTELIVTSQNLMRDYAFHQLRRARLDYSQAKISSRSCVSQRDIQRVFTLYQWVITSYTKFKPYGEQPFQDYIRRAVLVALGIVYYMRLNNQYREEYKKYLDKHIKLQNEVSFSQAFSDELDWYIEQVELPTGIAKTRALKENLFATIICAVTHTPLIIVGAPGSSKTLSFNLAIANLKGQESKNKSFRVFPSLDPQIYQCSRRTTSNEIETVFSRAINRQRSHSKFRLPIYCVVFMDEAGLPEESHESLKVLHYHLDKQEVSFVAITNHVLDAAKTNRAVSLFRPDTSEEDLKTLAKGCLYTNPSKPPPEKNLKVVVSFCSAYSHLMNDPEFSQYFGLRDFIHFVNYLRRYQASMLTPQLVMKALERNFNGSDNFSKICNTFLSKVQSNMNQVQCRGILEVLQASLEDRPQQFSRDMAEAEVRYMLIIDPSEDDSLVRLLFSFGVLQRKETRMFVCSNFPGDSQLQKINTIAAIRHSAIKGHTIVMTQTDDIHESFYDLFNQRFRIIDDRDGDTRYYTNIAIGAHMKPSRIDPKFQCVVVIKKSEVQDTPAPFLNRFEKYCITHHSILEMTLNRLPPCIRIIVEAAMEKVKDFINLVSGPSSFYGLQQETLTSLVLSVIPPLTHTYQPFGEPSVVDSGLDLKELLMQELLQNLRYCAGFHIPPYFRGELHLDAESLFDLVLSDPNFRGLFVNNLTHTAAIQAVRESMEVLHNAPPPQDGAVLLDLSISPEGCLVVALFQQWLVRYLCKQLMQLMTSEALTVYRNVLPSSYLENYLSFGSHFSLKELIEKHLKALEHSKLVSASSPTKLICFTRSSPLIHQLPAQYPSSVFEDKVTAKSQQILSDLVFPEFSQLFVCKLSNLISQNSVQEILRRFVQSDTTKVCLLIVNMEETTRQVVNHLRIMVEEAEVPSTQDPKLFVMLLHFPPPKFFDPCYPSLFLKGWNYCYLDTIAHNAGQGVVDIRDWFWQCCFPKQDLQQDSHMLELEEILQEAIPVLSSRVFFGCNQESSFNCPMNGSERSKALRLLFEKGVGNVLCERFRSYWKPAVMAEYLERAATFTQYCESTLNITDSIQTMFKSLFFDFLVYLLSRINEECNIDMLFNSDSTPTIDKLFLDILQVFPLPRLSQLQVLSTNLTTPTFHHPPRFPFFKLVCEAVERIVEQSHKDANVQLDLLQEKEIKTGSTSFHAHDHHAMYIALQDIARGRIEEKMKITPKESLVLAVEAMGLNFDLWQCYFDDFLFHKLQLGSGGISQQILHVFFEELYKEKTLVRVVSLHCYIHVYHLNLAKVANFLRPLNQIQQVAKAVPHLFLSVEGEPSEQLVSAVNQTANPLGTPEHIAIFVVNTLFNAILGATYDAQDVSMKTEVEPEKLIVWFKAYRDAMALLMLKRNVYMALGCEEKREGGVMEVVEARLNVMQTVFLVIQTSFSLGTDILQKGQQIFQTLFGRHFTNTLELRGQCPRLAEVMPVAVEVISETSRQFFIEGIFTHFFSPYRRSYHTNDVQWFMELANNQKHWTVNLMEHAQQQQVSQGVISMCVYKLHLGHILRSCEEHDEEAALSGPLLLYHHYPRSQIGRVLMDIPDLGSPAPYIPTFYQQCSLITLKANHKSPRMQQPLAHLYFLTLLEHLQAQEYKLSDLVRVANDITKHSTFAATEEVKRVVLWVELQAVIQVLIQNLATHLDLSEVQIGEVQPLVDDINRILDNVDTGGGDTQGHGMVLALHTLKQLKSSRKFSELLTKKYNFICRWIHCLQPFHQQFADPFDPKPHLLAFMLPHSKGTKLEALYTNVKKVMVNIHKGKKQEESLIQIARDCHTVRMSRGSPTDSSAREHCFSMMVWLCAYYDFYDKKVTSKRLCDLMGEKLAPYLKDKGCIRLIQCFLNPQLFLCHPESPNPFQEGMSVLKPDNYHALERRGEKVDPLHLLFVSCELDIDLRYSLANLVGVILGCPSRSNHLWYHLFSPGELHGTYMTGFMYDAMISPDGLLYDCGVELSPEGLFGRQDYVKHATRGTYTLHSLYLLLWANFGAFCMALLTQPEAEASIRGQIMSEQLSLRHYCLSQLRIVWVHMQKNLGLSDEERSFLVMCCTRRFYELFNTKSVAQDSHQGIFKTHQELDTYESMWHTNIYQPSWRELQTNYSSTWLNEHFMKIRCLEVYYPHFPTQQEFIHSVLSSGDIQSHVQGGDLYLLAQFAQELPHLQAGGQLLPDVVEFYHWLHTNFAYLVTKEHAAKLTIGQVIKLAVRRYSEEERGHLQELYSRVKEGYNRYMELIGGAIGAKKYAELRHGNKIFMMADDTPLLCFLSADQAEENDWLYTVAATIIAAHNAFIEGVYSPQVQEQSPSECFLPDKPAKVSPSEVNDSNCIVGKFESIHGVDDFLQLVRCRYKPSSSDASIELQQYASISSQLLETVKPPQFQLNLLKKDIVACFFAGKPLICNEPPLRMLFKFCQSPTSATAAADVVGSAGMDLDDIAERLHDTFKTPLNKTLQKQLEYEFHSASYHTMVEVVTGLKTVAGHLIKAIMQQNKVGLERQTVPEFMLTLYDLNRSSQVWKEIGVHSTSYSQLTCLMELPLTSLFCCLQLFTSWVRDGVYDFAALPFGLKIHMADKDLHSIEQIPSKWTGSLVGLVREIKQMNEVLKHSEAHITKTANESAHESIMQYLHLLGKKDYLPTYIPSSILIQHYVSFRIALRRLALTVQQKVELEAEGGDTEMEHWREAVDDLWDNRLPHLREIYNTGPFVYDPHTGRYGFQEGLGFDSKEDLMTGLMNEPEGESQASKGDVEASLSGDQSSSREEKERRAWRPQNIDEDAQTLEQNAREYTPEHVSQFLQGIGLGQHAIAFSREDISGEMLLEATDEMLKELGITSTVEMLKIKVLFQRSLQGGVVHYPIQTVLDFLKKVKLDKYGTIFEQWGIDGDLLLKADDSVLEELGVSSPVERNRIRTKYKTFVSQLKY